MNVLHVGAFKSIPLASGSVSPLQRSFLVTCLGNLKLRGTGSFSSITRSPSERYLSCLDRSCSRLYPLFNGCPCHWASGFQHAREREGAVCGTPGIFSVQAFKYNLCENPWVVLKLDWILWKRIPVSACQLSHGFLFVIAYCSHIPFRWWLDIQTLFYISSALIFYFLTLCFISYIKPCAMECKLLVFSRHQDIRNNPISGI